MTESNYKKGYMFALIFLQLLWSYPLSSYQQELEQRSIDNISAMIDSDQHEKIKNYIEQFQVELFVMIGFNTLLNPKPTPHPPCMNAMV